MKCHTTGKPIVSSKSSGGRKKIAAFEDHFFREELGRQIQKYKETGQYFNLDTLLSFAQKNLEYTGSRSTLYKIIKAMGFKYKYENNRKILIERTDIVAKIIKYLKC